MSKSNCLAIANPNLSKEWHPTKNGRVTPYKVVAGSAKKIWWKCLKHQNHEWIATVSSRNKGAKCPYCSNRKVSVTNSLSITNPTLAKEWHPLKNKLTPKEVTSGQGLKVWWRCLIDQSHEWVETINNRSRGNTCPFCKSRWNILKIKKFIESIIDYLDALTSSELYAIFQQNGLLTINKNNKRIFEALKTGKFPKEELENFCEGKPSLVDDIINDSSIALEDHLETEDLAHQEILEKEIEEDIKENDLPIIETKDALGVLNDKIFSSADKEAVEFFITSGCSKIWKHVFQNEDEAINQLKRFKGGKYPTEVKTRFLEEYYGAKNLKIPNGDTFVINEEKIKANLMQRLVAYRVKKYQKQGNWSGTGAGKTLSAIIASRVIDARFTIITCPNSVVEGWERNIKQAYPDSMVHTKTLNPKIDQKDKSHHYLVLNYEAFQQPNSEAEVKKLTKKIKIDFVVIDEIHFSKQRVLENMSKRKKVIAGMISHATGKKNNLHVLGMSATPVINNLFEGISLLEMITGIKYDDLNNKPTVNNCMALYQKLSTIGIRWMPEYKQKLNIVKIPVNCDKYISEIRELGAKHTMLDLEKILTRSRLEEIRKHIKPKTIIYTHYIEEIAKTLKDEIEKDGWSVAFFMGEDKSGKESFIKGNVDVLVASSAIGTGVDGLQKVCNRLITNILPWTHAEFEQLKGRIYRQGQREKEVDIIIPLTFAEVNGKNWSWCDSKWKRIQFKKSIADASVDGIVPEGHLRTPAQAYNDAMNWLKRLEQGKISEIERRKIHIPLSGIAIRKNIRVYGDFSKMNNSMNKTHSSKTHEKFQNDPKEWEQYHALYREARKEWPVVPYEEMINWCKLRPDLVIGDFGCGEAKIAELLDNTVHSFDHIGVNDSVIACDMSHVPLEDEMLDVAIFSLSLMGSNFTDYIKEAHRCLKLDGHLWIIEKTSRFSELKEFTRGLEKLGFDIVITEEKYKFTFIRGMKNDKRMQDIELKF